MGVVAPNVVYTHALVWCCSAVFVQLQQTCQLALCASCQQSLCLLFHVRISLAAELLFVIH
jgi:hypothetical protein